MSVRDSDLVSIQQARTLAARAKDAQRQLAGFSQEQVDRIVDAMELLGRRHPDVCVGWTHIGAGPLLEEIRALALEYAMRLLYSQQHPTADIVVVLQYARQFEKYLTEG